MLGANGAQAERVLDGHRLLVILRLGVPEIEDPVGMPTDVQHTIGRGVYDAANALALQLLGRAEPQRVGSDDAVLPRIV